MADRLISARAAIEFLMDNMAWYSGEGCEASEDEKRDAITELINGVPTAQPERMKAKWIVGGIEEDSTYIGSRWYECERCHTPGDLRDKFCRGCGAMMEGKE